MTHEETKAQFESVQDAVDAMTPDFGKPFKVEREDDGCWVVFYANQPITYFVRKNEAGKWEIF